MKAGYLPCKTCEGTGLYYRANEGGEAEPFMCEQCEGQGSRPSSMEELGYSLLIYLENHQGPTSQEHSLLTRIIQSGQKVEKSQRDLIDHVRCEASQEMLILEDKFLWIKTETTEFVFVKV